MSESSHGRERMLSVYSRNGSVSVNQTSGSIVLRPLLLGEPLLLSVLNGDILVKQTRIHVYHPT